MCVCSPTARNRSTPGHETLNPTSRSRLLAESLLQARVLTNARCVVVGGRVRFIGQSGLLVLHQRTAEQTFFCAIDDKGRDTPDHLKRRGPRVILCIMMHALSARHRNCKEMEGA